MAWVWLATDQTLEAAEALIKDDFKVMVRPLKAVNMLHQHMKAMLESMA